MTYISVILSLIGTEIGILLVCVCVCVEGTKSVCLQSTQMDKQSDVPSFQGWDLCPRTERAGTRAPEDRCKVIWSNKLCGEQASDLQDIGKQGAGAGDFGDREHL